MAWQIPEVFQGYRDRRRSSMDKFGVLRIKMKCHMVAGGFDYLVKARAADMTAYRRFLGEILLALPVCARRGPTLSWKR
jgi:DNA-binding Lrp family transcriptional regulator